MFRQRLLVVARRALSDQRPSSMQHISQTKAASPVLLAVPIITFGLGTWQIFRKKQKEDLIAELEQKLSQDPVALPADPAEVYEMPYSRVVVKGEFLHDKEMQVFPRTATREVFAGMSDIPQPGAQVVTPFRRADNGEVILINRGFVTEEMRSPAQREDGQLKGIQTIEGIVRTGETKTAFVPDNTPEKNQWHWLDLFTMAKHVDAVPIVIDVAEGGTPDNGWPLAGQTQINIRNEHMSYIITWYSLSVITLAMWMFLRRRGPTVPRRRLPPSLNSSPSTA